MGDGYMLGDSIAVLEWLDKAHTQANDSDLVTISAPHSLTHSLTHSLL